MIFQKFWVTPILLLVAVSTGSQWSSSYQWSSSSGSRSVPVASQSSSSSSSSQSASVASQSQQQASVGSNIYGQWSSNPNGQVRPIRNANTAQLNCGNCESGYVREAVNYYGQCGRCVPERQSCAAGYVMLNNQCTPCPCPGTTNERRFGTSCRVDVDGQITCDCGPEYTGRDCSQCAPGTVQTNQYPYSCVRVNSTSSQTSYCPPGNYCPQQQVPQVVVPPPQPSCGTNYCNPPQQCQVARPNPWPQPQPQPVNPCPVPLPGPGPILCPTAPPVTCPPCPTTCNQPAPCGVAPQPCPQPQQPCPIAPMPCPQPPQPCPIPPMPCPQPPQPCPVNPPIQCPPCPQPPACPTCPVVPPQPCPSPCPSPCPTIPQCPPCAGNNCPSPCPSPCPPIPQPPPCPPCPNPCQTCPEPRPCPTCPGCPPCPGPPPCNPCPNPCPPCIGGGGCNVTCPNPCQTCPSCPDCKLNVTCPQIPGVSIIVQPCICDTRGTVSQYMDTCYCKTNVEGRSCNTCKPGYFGMNGNRAEGCLQCWGSGVSSYCTSAVYYRSWIQPSRAVDCSVELTDEASTIVYNRDSHAKYSWDGKEARLSLSISTKLYWSLPACFKGNRLTSYGAILRFSRMFTGSGSNLGPDNDIIIVGGNGARLYFSSFTTLSSGGWDKTEVLLDETTHWLFYKNGNTRVATRFDILEVLADVHLILIRATFTQTTMSTSIRDIELGTVSKTYTIYGFVLVIEMARCPSGYQGLSCESCAAGYFRDATDMTASVFGACKLCPCGRNALGCHISYGIVYCKCKLGFTGDRCQDREVITVTLDPFWVRDCANTEIDFTCTFTTNSKRTLLMRLGLETDSSKQGEEVRSISASYTLSSTLGRVKCEIVDRSGTVWALVYAAMTIEPCEAAIIIPPKTITIMSDEFICVDEGERVEMRAKVFYYGPAQVKPDWFKEGESNPRFTGAEYIIARARTSDRGTYLVSAVQGDTVDVKQVVLVVRPRPGNVIQNDEPEILMLEGGNNMTSSKNFTTPKPKVLPPQVPRPSSFYNTMQKDQAVAGYPSVVVDPPEVKAKEGDTVTLRCNASGEEPMKFYWKSGAFDYIPVHVRVSRGALIFKSIRKEDAGSYYCVAWNELGQVAAKASIIVDGKNNEAPPQNPLSIFVSKTQLEVTEGTHAFLDCSTNHPNIKPTWSRKNGDLPSNSEIAKNGTLIIYRVRQEDAGAYLCKAMGPSGQYVEVEATLIFKPISSSTIPVITLNPKSPVKGRSGDNIKVQCLASGNPTPNVTWSRSIEGTDKTLVFSVDNMSTFEIPHLTKADEGKYSCMAMNSAGSKTESLSLVVDDAIICKSNEFRCKSGDQCVPKEDRCDQEKDCKDGSDEAHCTRKRSRRSARKFKN